MRHVPASAPRSSGRTDHRDDTQYAGFGEATWKMTDGWTAVGGHALLHRALTGVQTQTHPFGGFPGSPTLVPIPDPNETFNKVTWKGNLSYKFSESLLAYGTVSTGFRSGGLNPRSEPFEPIPGAYSPDTLTNYEVGAKGRLLERRVRLSGRRVLLQVGQHSGAGDHGRRSLRLLWAMPAKPRSKVSSSNRGPPVPVLLRLFRRLIPGCLSHPRSHAAQYKLNPTLGLTGEPIPSVPKFQLDLGPRVHGADRRLARHGGDGRATATPRILISPPILIYNIPLAPTRWWNLRAGVIQGPWSITAFARNLTDKRAQVSAINSAQDPDALLTVQPRTIGLTSTRTF